MVKGARQVTVTLADKKVYRARVLGTEARSDLALLKIDADRKLPTLPLGNSDSLVVGQKVLAIGNPFGQFGGTLTTGVVSALDRGIQTEEGGRLEGMIQTDAAINPGNSGGPLLDSHGSVIGINTAIYGPQGNIGIGFALPIGRAKAMLEDFEQSGSVSRPAPIGIQTLAVEGELADQLNLPREGGLLIQQVEPGSAADEAGLRGAYAVGDRGLDLPDQRGRRFDHGGGRATDDGQQLVATRTERQARRRYSDADHIPRRPEDGREAQTRGSSAAVIAPRADGPSGNNQFKRRQPFPQEP